MEGSAALTLEVVESEAQLPSVRAAGGGSRAGRWEVTPPGDGASERSRAATPRLCFRHENGDGMWGRDASGVWGPRDSLLERDADLAVLKDGPGCEGQWCHSEEEQGRGGSEPAGWGRGVLAPMSTWGPCQ